MQVEVYGLSDVGTFEEVKQPPKKYIHAKWCITEKADEYGWPTKLKLRLVARRDQTRANIGELFASTVAVSCVCVLEAMACEVDLDLCHFVIEQAFVQEELEEDV